MNWMRWKSTADRLGDGLDRHRLGQAGHALDEHVPSRQQGDDQPLEQHVLADESFFTSNTTCSIGALWLGAACSRVLHVRMVLAYEWSWMSLLRCSCCATGGGDRYGEADADEEGLVRRDWPGR